MSDSGKLVSLSNLVRDHVRSGQCLFIGGFGHCVPFALAHEILRQKLANLTICRSGTDILFDQMIGAGAVAKVIFGYIGNPGVGLSHAFRRAVKDNRIDVEEWTNFSIILRFHAARMGVPFLPSRVLQVGDIHKASIEVKSIDCPYTGERLSCIPALKPDVALVHAQRADEAGNIQFYGIDGDTIEGALASRKILVTVEEVVTTDELSRSPETVRLPSYRVTALAKVEMGAHPSYVSGMYGRDDDHFRDYDRISRDPDELAQYFDHWVYEVKSRQDYLDRIPQETRSNLLNHYGKD